MQHIKDYWRESEVFHASNLNEIARVINGLIDAVEAVINDGEMSSDSTYSSAKIVELLADAGFKTAVVNELPLTGDSNTIYFVPSSDPKEKDVSDEFIFVDNKWERIGSTRIDFSNYYTKTEVDTKLGEKQSTINDLEQIRSGAALGATALQSYTETDPTVPAWAKAANKPTYTAQEVGALPSTTTIPSKVSQLTNDSGYITGYTESDPTVPAWAKTENKPTYTASEVGAQEIINDLDTIRSGATLGLTALQEMPNVTVEQVMEVLEREEE